jgi:protein-disulfide isomerase
MSVAKTYVRPLLVTVGIVVALALIAFLWVLMNRSDRADGIGPADGSVGGSAQAQTVRDDSIVLDDGGPGAVTVVEFLDFECEACGAAYPLVEDLRTRYTGEITYVVRYFPLPGHVNSLNAALAAEAASQQGKFEEMYHALFQSQSEWGEAQETRTDLFRSFAEDIGLDMTMYDHAVSDPATTLRISSDFEDGRALGVASTPTFFVNDRPVQLSQWTDLIDAVEAELPR